jgi:nitrogen-specific signal transduction histidine kinase
MIATRLACASSLCTSIAHEIKQPIATARNNASAALNFLEKSPPDVAEVREAAACIVKDTDRASDIVDRIRSLTKKMPPRRLSTSHWCATASSRASGVRAAVMSLRATAAA